MSGGLYTAMFGVNRMAAPLLAVLNLSPEECGRFRDCYFAGTPESPEIHIHTRNGGGNRPDYEMYTALLRAHPLYLGDADEEYDRTYATYRFSVPEELRSLGAELCKETIPPGERWKKLLEEMSEPGPKTEEAERAIQFGKEIMKPVIDFLKEQKP